MPIRALRIPVRFGEWAEREMNQVLQMTKVISIERRWVEMGENSYWAVWIEYLGNVPQVDPTNDELDRKIDIQTSSEKRKIDYKERLSPEDFTTYLKLRDFRKAIAAEEGVALYNIFNNEQLALMVERKVRTQADLQQIPSVGDARLDKYGARFLELLKQLTAAGESAGEGESANEESRKAD